MSVSTSPMTADPATITRARDGDRLAFESLVIDCGADVLRLCMVITTDRALAEDASQNTWRQVWRRLGDIRDVGRFRPWLMRVAANEAKQLVRRRHRERPLEEALALPGPSVDPELAAITEAIRRLPINDRTIIAQRYVLGLTSAEIAAEQGISAEGIRTRLSRIRQRLREELAQ